MCRTYTGIYIPYLECGGHFGRHLGFLTFNMFRKNATLILLKAYDIFCQNQVSFCFYQTKYTKLQINLH